MKALLTRVLERVVGNDWAWLALRKTVIPLANQARACRARVVPAEVPETIAAIFRSKTVLHGPFAGLRYPDFVAVGSSLFPKLLGSYERELTQVIERICATPYQLIIDIGCAEGYYAVGLARRIPTARVLAFDTNSDARRLCGQLAELNGVADRVRTDGLCDTQRLREIATEDKLLVISDCEGYESEFFTPEMCRQLAHADCLIEIHDFVDVEISARLRSAFQNTHDIEIIRSVDDVRKTWEYSYPELLPLPMNVRRQIVQEYRPGVMEWFFATPRKRA